MESLVNISSQKPVTSYSEMIRVTKDYIGVHPLLKYENNQMLDQRYKGLISELIDVMRPASTLRSYFYQVVFFLKGLAAIEMEDSFDRVPAFRLIDLSDYCNGLPPCDHIVRVFTRMYQETANLDTKIASAECLGRLRTGAFKASPFFLALLTQNDRNAVVKTTRAISRTMSIQSTLAQEYALWGGEMVSLKNAIEVDVNKLQDRLCDVARDEDLSRLLTEGNCLSSLTLLKHAQRNDEEFFRSQRDWLLREHLGEFVAVRNLKIITFASNPQSLEHSIQQIMGSDVRVFAAKICPESFQPKSPITIFTV